MQELLDILQNLSRSRSRGENGPLIMLRELDSGEGQRISHLPVESELAQAWLAYTGEPFRPHQAQTLTALRRSEPVALFAANPAILQTAFLMIYAQIFADPPASALILAQNQLSVEALYQQHQAINQAMPPEFRLAATMLDASVRPNPTAPIVIATPEALHAHLLCHHDRAWSLFWSRLRLTVISDLHEYRGIASAHLGDLLLRLERVAMAHSGQHPGLLGLSVEARDPQEALALLMGQPWRVVGGDDMPYDASALAVWHGSGDRLREVAELATTLARNEFHVHVLCRPFESITLGPILSDVDGVSFGHVPRPAQVLLTAGYPGARGDVRRLLRSGYQVVALVLGETLSEKMIARHTESLLSEPPETWAPVPPNAYVTAQHVLCAASELPLTANEVDRWGAQAIVDRLVDNEQLVDLPDEEIAWKPTPKTGEPYAEFSLLSASGAAILAKSERGTIIDQFDPTEFERWTYPNAALPPGAGGARVAARDEQEATITLRMESNGRRSYPLRNCSLTIREERESHTLFVTRRCGLARVVLDEEIYAYREVTGAGNAVEQPIKPPLSARWIAPAVWMEVPAGIQVSGQFIGWSLVAAVQLRARAAFTDLVTCYDAEAGRIYLVDAQPGGSGLAAWAFGQLEELLPLAYDVAYASRNDPLLELLARVDMDWLLPLIGSHRHAEPETAPAPTAAPSESKRPAPRRPELVEGPPPATPRIILAPPRETEESVPERKTPAPEKTTPPTAIPPRSSERKPPEQSAATPARNQPEPNEPAANTADASALIDRLRRQRQQREASGQRQKAPPERSRPTSSSKQQARFTAGDQIFCLPYGDGTVVRSWFDDEREMLAVRFPDHGELTIDPAVSLVRKIEQDDPDDDDLL